MKKLNKHNPYGTWKVTTEGDCEGRSIKKLGTHTGYIDEIAFGLANKCAYSLDFDRVENDHVDLSPKSSEVNVRIEMHDKGTAERYFKNRPCFVKKCTFYKSITLYREISEEEIKANKIKAELVKDGYDVEELKKILSV